MDPKTLASWLIVAGLVVIAVQIGVSLATALKVKKEKEQPSTRGLGDLLSEILKALATSIPLGVLGFLLIIVGAIIGGYLNVDALFPPATNS